MTTRSSAGSRTTPAVCIVAAACAAFSLQSAEPALAGDLLRIDVNEIDPNSWDMMLTGMSDHLTIKNVVVNRGYCKPQGAPAFPQGLSFGEMHLYGYFICDPIQVDVDTDAGTETFTVGHGTSGVSVQKEPISDAVWQIAITARIDAVNVNKITVNHGNCRTVTMKSEDHDGPSNKLHFGQRMLVAAACDPLEVTVDADSGSATFNF